MPLVQISPLKYSTPMSQPNLCVQLWRKWAWLWQYPPCCLSADHHPSLCRYTPWCLSSRSPTSSPTPTPIVPVQYGWYGPGSGCVRRGVSPADHPSLPFHPTYLYNMADMGLAVSVSPVVSLQQITHPCPFPQPTCAIWRIWAWRWLCPPWCPSSRSATLLSWIWCPDCMHITVVLWSLPQFSNCMIELIFLYSLYYLQLSYTSMKRVK